MAHQVRRTIHFSFKDHPPSRQEKDELGLVVVMSALSILL
jgi:hypothetical protein